MPTSLLKQAANILETISTEEQQWLTFFSQMGIGAKGVPNKPGVYQLDMPGSPIFKLFNSLSELRENEQLLEQAADAANRPIIGAIPLGAFGGTTFVPGVGPVPCVTVKAGPLTAEWALNGHRLMNQLAVTLRSEAAKLEEDPKAKTPYIQYLMTALGIKEKPSDLKGVTELGNKAAEAPHIIGLPAALQAAAGRGSHQAVFMFNPAQKIDTESTLPEFKQDSWLMYDLSRAIGDETSSSRRAHGFVHQCLITAMEMEQNLFVSYRVSNGVKKELTKVRQQLQVI